ncbi:MAG TPA: hypothetical protein VKB46_03975 [Pyrinomonadaceae bacterium]|nr:hypothetical protein [Pyrinomonadaceae bacterium]
MKRSLVSSKTKRYLALVLMFFMLSFAVEPMFTVTSVSAQTRTRYHRRHRSFWKKHRDKLTVAGTTGVGAAIGGIAGGGKGAAIGALAGAGGGALYTYKLRKRHKRHYHRY